LLMLFKLYMFAAAAALFTVGLFVYAAQSAGLTRDHGPMDVGRGLSLPPHTEVAGAPPWWAAIFALVADATLFTSLLFGALYLWISAPNWPPAELPDPNLPLTIIALVAPACASIASRGALRTTAAGRSPGVWIAAASAALVAALVVVIILIGGIVPHPREHALAATNAALLGYVALHSFIGLLFMLSNVLRFNAGRISALRLTDLRLSRLWLDYTATTAAVAMCLILILPTLAAMLKVRP
ncbi:MAG: hypothetical protein KDE31_06300, partial [Caldilineaceae bacterium]|nr:hypothetical protein [Caldilineaceae bacterium]